jgi:hypothetical protein
MVTIKRSPIDLFMEGYITCATCNTQMRRSDGFIFYDNGLETVDFKCRDCAKRDRE